MQRVTISLDDELAASFDRLIAGRGYENRSEAVRDLIRQQLDREAQDHAPHGHCVASLSYVYNHHARDLAERIAERQHAHHDLVVATMHVHLDHENCLETAVLQGPVAAVRELAGSLTAEPGVRHGSLNLVAVEQAEHHAHGGRTHRHMKPRY
ncbi:MAG TPA: nickel-responsive transcriptional regulator NikR [Steroidobacteraceae bacterium]|nr:nickel-responsive transcriptional regulator NikR [Steroidobacteraceae bacterium]HNS26687.1 nickel-responsive transcriptional regulator NikR [Steroidobacteraceae bacterium]